MNAVKSIMKFIKKVVKFIIFLTTHGMLIFWILLLLMVSTVIVMVVETESNSSITTDTFTKFDPMVEAYRSAVTNTCGTYFISDYPNVILAMMQASTGGYGNDVMDIGHSSYNQLYGQYRGGIEDPYYSIEVGVQEFRDLLQDAEVVNTSDYENLYIAIQAFHFNKGFIKYAKDHGGYTPEVATAYKKNTPTIPGFLNASFATQVMSYFNIMSGYIQEFSMPIDPERSSLLYTFGDAMSSGKCQGTYFISNEKEPIYAIADGTVTYINSGVIIIDHGNYKSEYRTIEEKDYLYPEEIVNADETVEYEDVMVGGGDLIGYTQQSEEEGEERYLFYFQIMSEGKYVDPLQFIDFRVSGDYTSDTSNNNLRDSIVDFAKLWMNTPYVWGGTSLEKGVDCSGYVQAIYKNFGISIPRTSRQQAAYNGAVWTTTEGICPNILAKGDLIFYVNDSGTINHVTLYIGNGYIIGAGSEETGIRIQEYNYRVLLK